MSLDNPLKKRRLSRFFKQISSANVTESQKISGRLAERCRELLTDRNRATLLGMIGKISEAHRPQWWEHTYGYSPHRYRSGRMWLLSSDHVARSRALFDLAEEVKAATSR